MQDIEDKDRIKLFAICGAILILAYLIGNWVSVEYIASLQDYDPALPGHLYDETPLFRFTFGATMQKSWNGWGQRFVGIPCLPGYFMPSVSFAAIRPIEVCNGCQVTAPLDGPKRKIS